MRQTFEKDGKVRSFEVAYDRVMATVQIGGEWVANPTLEAFLVDGWREYVVPEPTPYQPTYEEQVVELIRLRYDVNAELAILRQRDSKPASVFFASFVNIHHFAGGHFKPPAEVIKADLSADDKYAVFFQQLLVFIQRVGK